MIGGFYLLPIQGPYPDVLVVVTGIYPDGDLEVLALEAHVANGVRLEAERLYTVPKDRISELTLVTPAEEGEGWGASQKKKPMAIPAPSEAPGRIAPAEPTPTPARPRATRRPPAAPPVTLSPAPTVLTPAPARSRAPRRAPVGRPSTAPPAVTVVTSELPALPPASAPASAPAPRPAPRPAPTQTLGSGDLGATMRRISSSSAPALPAAPTRPAEGAGCGFPRRVSDAEVRAVMDTLIATLRALNAHPSVYHPGESATMAKVLREALENGCSSGEAVSLAMGRVMQLPRGAAAPELAPRPLAPFRQGGRTPPPGPALPVELPPAPAPVPAPVPAPARLGPEVGEWWIARYAGQRIEGEVVALAGGQALLRVNRIDIWLPVGSLVAKSADVPF